MPDGEFGLIVLAGIIALASLTVLGVAVVVNSGSSLNPGRAPFALPGAERWNVLHDAEGNVKSITVSRG